MAAAEQVFVERGIHQTHMADIATRAGVAVGTLYNHYKDRDALLTALAAQRRCELLERIDACFEKNANKPFRTELRETLRVIYSHVEKHWQFFATFISQADPAQSAIAQPALAMQNELYRRFAALIERGRKQRVLRPKMAQLAPALLMGMTKAMLTRRLFVPEDDSPLDHVDTLVEFFLEGAGGKSA